MKIKTVAALCLAPAVIILLTTVSSGIAQERGAHRNPPAVEPTGSQQPCTNVEDCTDKQFNNSGTEGREGLGAEPSHPEGPGNENY